MLLHLPAVTRWDAAEAEVYNGLRHNGTAKTERNIVTVKRIEVFYAGDVVRCLLFFIDIFSYTPFK